MKWGRPSPPELMIWTMAERFGWTIEYIESLSIGRIHEWYQIEAAKAKARGQ